MSSAGDEARLDGRGGGQVVAASAHAIDWAARVVIVAVFSSLAVFNFAGIYHMFPLDRPEKVLAVAARLANFLFLILIAATALTRLSPILKARVEGSAAGRAADPR